MLAFHKKSFALLALLGMLIPTASAHAETMELTGTSQMMETHPSIVNGVLPMYKEWERRCNGEIHVTYFNPGTLCPVGDIFNVAQKGAIDLAQNVAGSVPGMFPLITGVEMPMLFNSARSAVITSLVVLESNELLQQEFKDWKVLNLGASAPRQLVSVRKPILTMADIKGMKVGVVNPQGGEAISALGGVPVVLPLNDMYLALQRGLVEAASLPIPTFRSTKVTEVAKHITIVDLGPGPVINLMNRKTYEALPAKAKEELDKLAGRPYGTMNSHFSDYYSVVDLDWVVKNHKVNVYKLDPEERARWAQAMTPVYEVWIAKTKKQGVVDPGAFLEVLKTTAKDFDENEELWNNLQAQKEILGTLFPSDDVLKALYPEKFPSAQ